MLLYEFVQLLLSSTDSYYRGLGRLLENPGCQVLSDTAGGADDEDFFVGERHIGGEVLSYAKSDGL